MYSFVVTVLEEHQGKCDKASQNQDSCPSSKAARTPWQYPRSSCWTEDDLLWFVNGLEERQFKLKKVVLYLRVPNADR